ncbi:MAG: prepilin-type N-terminal cleavage/methylation domain-containing protein [Xenococcaceae cyanobacterium MO_188.B19]|nr:prepilin-type N-terminal cleavage/methylation domain-containing protein [Xenococcaceae cyanobacterium MO_188.B19]
MNLYQFYKIRNQSKKSNGFTLTELLVGALISTIVIGGAGWGLMQMLNVTLDNSDQTERRAEINRAMDFVSDEIRRAKRVWTNYPDYTDSPGNADVANSTTVLELQIPDVDGDGDDEFIAYYIKESPNISSNWRGPQALYRLGPPLDADGEYSINSSTGFLNARTPSILIDSLQKRTTPGCAGTMFPTPISGEVPGFAVCLENSMTIPDVDSDGLDETAYETAHLFFSGVFDSDAGSETYLADSKTFARVDDDVTTAAIIDKGSSFTGTLGGSCSVSGSSLSCTNDTIVSVRSLGSVYACDTSTNWKMKTEIKIGTLDASGNITDNSPDILDDNTTSQIVNLSGGDSIEVTSDPYLGNSWTNPDTSAEDNCLNSSDPVSSKNNVQVSVLDITSNTFSYKDGYTDENNNQQDSVFKILDDEGLVLTKAQIINGNNSQFQIQDDGINITISELQDDGSYAVTTDYEIKEINGTDYLVKSNGEYVLNVEKNQQVFLYLVEIGQDNPSSSGFDQQDNVVLVVAESQ